MASRISPILALPLIAACGRSTVHSPKKNAPEDPVTKTIRHAWTATVVGTITRIDRNNVDKTGRHPKWFVNVFVDPTKIDAPLGRSVVGEVEFVTKESELLPMLGGTMPKVGDVFVGTGESYDDQTSVLLLTGAALQ